MKTKRNAVRTLTYLSGTLALSSALILCVLLLMSSVGLINPRKTRIVLTTPTVNTVYNEKNVDGGNAEISYGRLREGHTLEILSRFSQKDVGSYVNKPVYRITDSTGADVTDTYEITEKFGTINIKGIPITVISGDREKIYDGEALVSAEITCVGGPLISGHEFVCDGVTELTEPGEVDIAPLYRVLDKDGNDVTHQYEVTNELGSLTVTPVKLTVTTSSKQSVYNGKALESSEWSLDSGALLKSHKLNVKCTGSLTKVGKIGNGAVISITDEGGSDVSRYYEVELNEGTLELDPIVLGIQTESATKEYDGTPLENRSWTLSSGKLMSSHTLMAVKYPALNSAGTLENSITFAVVDSEGADVSAFYSIKQSSGTLTVTPKEITVRTGSATKTYDGTPLECQEIEIIKGALCAGHQLSASLTTLVNIGYTDNYPVSLTISVKDTEGNTLNVTGNYRITYDYGVLTVKPD